MLTSEMIRKGMPESGKKSDVYLPQILDVFSSFNIVTPQEQSAYLAQVAVETEELNVMEENLNYGAPGLMATFPDEFPDMTKAYDYARQPMRIANCVYANRMGNGDESSGDGWKYRGRGFFQITGKSNYEQCGTLLKLDLLNHPDLLVDPANAAKSSGWFWTIHNFNALSSPENFRELCIRFAGSEEGYAQRLKYYQKFSILLA